MSKLQSERDTEAGRKNIPSAPATEALLGEGALSFKFDESPKDTTFTILFATNLFIVVALAFTAGLYSLRY